MMKFNSIIYVTLTLIGMSTNLTFAQQMELPKLDDLKINQIQVLGTHNSYAQPVDPKLLAIADPIFEKIMKNMSAVIPADQLEKYKEFHPNDVKMSEALKYDHPPFDVQLDSGLRSLEMDVYYDPTGNRFNNPAGYETLKSQGLTDLAPFKKDGLEKPGFKLLHIADLDFRTHYVTFKEGLTALKKWSDEHPNHLPIFIMIEAKDKGIPIFQHAAEVLPFDETAFDQLDAEVIDVLGREKLIIPDDVQGKYNTLRDAVLAHNWPTVKEARGKFIFLLLPATAGMNIASAYIKERSNLAGRAMFVQSTTNDTFASFLLLDNATLRQQEIQDYVKQGYLVRTRADIETYEAMVNDDTRAQAAFNSGAQVISTDFFRPGNTYGTPYVVKMPGKDHVRANPVNTKPIK